MKQLLVILSAFISLTANAQFSKELEAFLSQTHSKYKLPVQHDKDTVEFKRKFLREMYKDSTSFLHKHYDRTFSKHWKRNGKFTYISDFDSDGDNDVIYYGVSFPASENSNVVIYFNTDSGYVEKHLGIYLDTIYKNNSGYFLQTTFWLPSDDYTTIMQYQIHTESPNQIIQTENQLFTYYNPSSTNKTDTVLCFDTTKVLFFSPNTDSDFLGIVPTNFCINAYNTIVLNGKKWYYVVIEMDRGFELRERVNIDYFGKIKTTRGWICGN